MTIGADIRETFFQECDDLLESTFDGLSRMSEAPPDNSADPDREEINAIFRAVHSIKGGAAAFQLSDLVGFAHRFENTLDLLRSGKVTYSAPLAAVLQRAADHLADLVRAARQGESPDSDRGEALSLQLEAFGSAAPAAAPPSEDLGFVPLPLSFDFALDPESPPDHWHIRFAALPGLLESGNDPVHLLRELATLGHMRSTADLDHLPEFEKLDPEELYLTWDIHLETTAGRAQFDQVFEFVDGLCTLEIDRVPKETPAQKALSTATFPDLDSAERTPIEPATAFPTLPTADLPRSPSGTAAPRATLRVDLAQIDFLINLVGELVIHQSVLNRRLSDRLGDMGLASSDDVAGALSDLQNLTREIQENVMAIRAQQVKPLFQRMARIARDAADLAGKEMRFVTEGEATEVDKIVIEQLVDPLTHMIRNAIDHGLESPDQRRAAGKAEQGQVRLSAAHRSGRVVIELSDDGGGINRPKVLEKARSRGLVPQDAILSEAEIDNLLFLPGFSTAEAVTSLSGRGVGLDVVSGAIRKLGGKITVQSTQGKGTTMSISLPLTLAVLEGMVVQVAEETMVLPIAAIQQTLKPTPDAVQAITQGGHVLQLRDRILPVLDLGQVFGLRKEPIPADQLVHLIVETESGLSCAFGVDAIHDQQQVVIKGLETNYGHVPCVAAATILGNGRISLIIDPEEAARFSGVAA